eukprot:6175347-Pleurochrysis_carterae.AAC.5
MAYRLYSANIPPGMASMSTVKGAAQARGLGRAWAVALGRGAQRSGAAIASKSFLELGERSASAPQ